MKELENQIFQVKFFIPCCKNEKTEDIISGNYLNNAILLSD